MEKQQSLSNGTKCSFSFNGLLNECLQDTDITKEQAKLLEGADCIIESLETYSELGDKNFEYYNVTFTDSKISLIGISGYHLTVK